MTTVTGNIKDSNGDPVVGEVRIEPVNQLRILDGVTVRTKIVTVDSDSDGEFEIDLFTGSYKVKLPGGEPLTIFVPNDDGTYDISELVSGGLVAATPLATDTVSGKVKLSQASVPPVVVTLGHLQTLRGNNFRFKLKDDDIIEWQSQNPDTELFHKIIATDIGGGVIGLTLDQTGEE